MKELKQTSLNEFFRITVSSSPKLLGLSKLNSSPSPPSIVKKRQTRKSRKMNVKRYYHLPEESNELLKKSCNSSEIIEVISDDEYSPNHSQLSYQFTPNRSQTSNTSITDTSINYTIDDGADADVSFDDKIKLNNNNLDQFDVNYTDDFDDTSTFIQLLLPPSVRIEPVDFNLEEIYFNLNTDSQEPLQWWELTSEILSNAESHELDPTDTDKTEQKNAMFQAMKSVFSYKINCAYFNSEELNMVLKLVNLPKKQQDAFVNLIFWKHCWHRFSQTSDSLTATRPKNITIGIINYFKSIGLINTCIENESLEIILELALLKELQQLCSEFKISNKGKKEEIISNLLKVANAKTITTFFQSKTTVREKMKSKIIKIIGQCFKITDHYYNLAKRILVLLYPTRLRDEPLHSIRNMVFEASDIIEEKVRVYPVHMSILQFPIFKNRQHLIEYTEANDKLIEITQMTLKKNWTQVKLIGIDAFDKLQYIIESNKGLSSSFNGSNVPSYIRKFSLSSILSKIITLSLPAFKKDDVDTAIEYLETLINNCHIIQGPIGKWYDELAMIMMSYKQNCEKSAELSIKALTENNLRISDKELIYDRLKKLLVKRKYLSELTYLKIENLIRSNEISYNSVNNRIVHGIKVSNETKKTGKSEWRLKLNNTDVYCNVEKLASYHYWQDGFNNSIHCEGNLPITLMTCAFWEEIYIVPVPSAVLSPYQIAPLDLFSSSFYENRKDEIEEKIILFGDMDVEGFSNFIVSRYEQAIRNKYFSLINQQLVSSSDNLKEIVCCLGIKGVVGICVILMKSYLEMKAGFPDLFVWNPTTFDYRIVEVKGPGDSLSVKQKLWLKFLQDLDLKVELCHVVEK